ncbi:MAG: hypothetical protein WC595_01280 [Candidatus Nanoarchaeia archaeon]
MVEFEVVNGELRTKKNLTQLDVFVIDTLTILSRFVDYVLISGYVSIFFGRARGTEDVDVFIDEISEEKFKEFYNAALEKGYEFNIDNAEELYKDYLQDNLSVNMWGKNLPLVRLEIKIAKKYSQKRVLNERVKVFYNGGFLYFSPIEYQIAYKKSILKSEKDLEDARHLEVVFKNLDKEKIEEYVGVVLKEFEDE